MPARVLGDQLPADWILGNQIGVLAYALMQRNRELMREGDLRNGLIETFVSKLQYAEERLDAAALPISTLHLLAQGDLADGLPTRHRAILGDWKRKFYQVTRGRKDEEAQEVPKPSQANAAKLIAHQILYSDASAKAILGALSTYLSNGFDAILDSDSEVLALGRAVATLRRTNNSTATYVGGVITLNALLSRYSMRSLMILNALLDSLLAWPIVMFGDKKGKPVGAIAVPVAVDLFFDDRDHVEFRSVSHGGSGENIVDGWAAYLRHAADIGKQLWRAKNGNSGTLRHRMEEASISFDFTIIEKIFKNTLLEAKFADQSMEAYFAQIVLAKASGRYPSIGAAISGSIGEQRTILVDRPNGSFSATGGTQVAGTESQPPTEDAELDFPETIEEQTVLDWRFDWPQGVVQKKGYVYNSYKYNRFVLPPARQDFDADHGRHENYIETNSCRYLSDVADCVQVGGWRQFRYIRCPDVMHTLHRYSAELPKADTDGVQECLSLLKSQQGPILKIPQSIGVAAVFGALHHINFTLRLQDALPAPSLNWSVVRSIPEESNVRFWHLILRRAIGAAVDSENQLLLAASPDEGARLIADALNISSGIPNLRAERPADLLIILGCKHHASQISDELAKIVQPVSFASLIDALESKHIRPVLSEKMQALLGYTRIILVDSDDAVGADGPADTLDSRDDIETLARLSTFRNGFNFQMANSILWNMYDKPQAPNADQPGMPPIPLRIREKLQSLVSRGFITRGGGWYRLRPLSKTQMALLTRRSDLALANGHFYAALGFAPYLLTRAVPGLNVAEAMLPEHVREAVFHFEEAAAHANSHLLNNPSDISIAGIRKQARLAQERLMRFFDVPSWGVVTHLSRDRKEMPTQEAYELAKDLLEKWSIAKKEPQPRAWSISARATERYWDEERRELEKRRQSKDMDYVAQRATRVEKLFNEVIEMYERAVKSAANSPVYRNELLLNVSTHYSAFLHLYSKNRQELISRRDQLDTDIWSFLGANVTAYALEGRWFECVGDRCASHADALRAYLLGCIHVPKWRALWTKALGCVTLTGSDTGEIIDRLRQSPDVDIDEFCSWNKARKNWSMNKLKLPAVEQRWNQGKRIVLDNFDQANTSSAPHGRGRPSSRHALGRHLA